MVEASNPSADVPVDSLPPSCNAQNSEDGNGSGRLRALSTELKESNPPLGMWSATAHASSKAPTLGESPRGSYGHAGWDAEGQQRQRGSSISGNEASGTGPVRKNTSTSIPGSPLDKAATREPRIEEKTVENEGVAGSSNGGGKPSDQAYAAPISAQARLISS